MTSTTTTPAAANVDAGTAVIPHDADDNHDDADDPDIPLLVWWALESKADLDRAAVLEMFDDADLWSQPAVEHTILGRLMQRYVMVGGEDDFAAAARLFELAPSVDQAKVLMSGLQEGLRGRDIQELPPVLVKALQPYQDDFKDESLVLALRQGQEEAIEQALEIISDEQAEIGQRLSYIRTLGEIHQPASVPVLLEVMESSQSSGALRQASLQALQRYDDEEIGSRVVKAYPTRLRADSDVRAAALALFASRPSWAHQLIDAIDGKKEITRESIARSISKEDVPEPIVRQLLLLDDPTIDAATERLWPETKLATSTEKNERIAQVAELLGSAEGNPSIGQSIYQSRCGSCHRLFDSGGTIGPDLTGYDRSNLDYLLLNIVDPNADIREGYVNYHITTKDGRTLVGTLTNRSGETVTIQPLGGEAITLSSEQIETMQAQPTSLMPERLLDGLSDQQIRDLFAYLMQKTQ